MLIRTRYICKVVAASVNVLWIPLSIDVCIAVLYTHICAFIISSV